MIEQMQISGYRVAIERRGRGQPIVFLHGWPLHRATWRHVIPLLEDRFECILIDFPGLGDTDFEQERRLGFRGLAELVQQVADHLRLRRFSLVAHDTGGTVARLVAAAEPDRITSLLLINTEIPGHRPPYIRFYQTVLPLPLVVDGLRVLLDLTAFLRSPMGFGGCFWDLDQIDRAFRELFVAPLIKDRRRAQGAIQYLTALEWSVIDELAETHRRITAPVSLLWGADDPTFPLEHARAMVPQFPHATLIPIQKAKLLVHEERPREIADAILKGCVSTSRDLARTI